MKTDVKNIAINGDYGIVPISMRMPNGDLKRRYLRRLLEYGVVIPSEQVNRLLLEVLIELDTSYHIIRSLGEENDCLIEGIDIIDEKYEGEIENLESRIESLEDDVNDLQADMAVMYRESMGAAFDEGEKSVH